MSLFEKRDYYKPFEYPEFFEAHQLQTKMHWIASEIPLADDVRDFNSKLSKPEKNLLTQLFRFFTTADVDVANGYLDHYIPMFQPIEIRMALASFSAMEAIHIESYSLLIDTLGLPETEFKTFLEYDAMKKKHDYLENISTDTSDIESVAKSLAIYSAFTEGLMLFSSFAILLSFPQRNLMKGMGQIISFSQKDESLHVETMVKLFHRLIDAYPKVWNNKLKSQLYQAAFDCVELEDKFIDLAFEAGDLPNLTKEEIKIYIRYLADKRLLQLGLKPKFKVKENNLKWLDWISNGVEHSNFFEARSTEYSKGSLTGNWSDVWKKYDVSDGMPNEQSQIDAE